MLSIRFQIFHDDFHKFLVHLWHLSDNASFTKNIKTLENGGNLGVDVNKKLN